MSPRPKPVPRQPVLRQQRRLQHLEMDSQHLAPLAQGAEVRRAETQEAFLHLLVEQKRVHLVIELAVEPVLPAARVGAGLRVRGQQRRVRIALLQMLQNRAAFADDHLGASLPLHQDRRRPPRG